MRDRAGDGPWACGMEGCARAKTAASPTAGPGRPLGSADRANLSTGRATARRSFGEAVGVVDVGVLDVGVVDVGVVDVVARDAERDGAVRSVRFDAGAVITGRAGVGRTALDRHFGAAQVAGARVDLAGVREHIDHAGALVEQYRWRQSGGIVAMNRGMLAHVTGDLDLAEQLYGQGVELIRQTGALDAEGIAGVAWVTMRVTQGRIGEFGSQPRGHHQCPGRGARHVGPVGGRSGSHPGGPRGTTRAPTGTPRLLPVVVPHHAGDGRGDPGGAVAGRRGVHRPAGLRGPDRRGRRQRVRPRTGRHAAGW